MPKPPLTDPEVIKSLLVGASIGGDNQADWEMIMREEYEASPAEIITAFMMMAGAASLRYASEGLDLEEHRQQTLKAFDTISEIMWTKDPLAAWAQLNGKKVSSQASERGSQEN
jgi:hypothetical protein